MLDISALLKEYSAGAEALNSKVGTLSEEALNAIPVPGKWSIRQVVCHIADFEIVGADRIKRVLAEDNPTLLDGDPDLFAQSLHYADRDLQNELRLISAVRNSVAQILAACNVEVFRRTGVHSVEGPMTLESLLERCVKHLPHHLKFIDEKLQVLAAGGSQ